jgi:two-component system LytT family response regulator
MMIKACIIDDEKKARDILQNLLEHYCKEVNIIGHSDSVENGYEFIVSNRPELVFLDVEMPRGSGFELLKKFDIVPFKTIFVTAHNHYAIKAIKFSAIDYLLKPVDVDELIIAVERVINSSTESNSQQYVNLFENLDVNKTSKIAVPVKDGVSFIDPHDIIWMQADGSYTYIFTDKDKFTATKNIKEYEDLLSDRKFFRVHNSYLINLKHVKHFSRVDGYFAIMSDGSQVEVSRRRKDQFLQLMNA